jgi:hypothetical protein
MSRSSTTPSSWYLVTALAPAACRCSFCSLCCHMPASPLILMYNAPSLTYPLLVSVYTKVTCEPVVPVYTPYIVICWYHYCTSYFRSHVYCRTSLYHAQYVFDHTTAPTQTQYVFICWCRFSYCNTLWRCSYTHAWRGVVHQYLS